MVRKVRSEVGHRLMSAFIGRLSAESLGRLIEILAEQLPSILSTMECEVADAEKVS